MSENFLIAARERYEGPFGVQRLDVVQPQAPLAEMGLIRPGWGEPGFPEGFWQVVCTSLGGGLAGTLW